MTQAEIKTADRESLISYLESWGFGVYAHEPTEELRTAALLNQKTEKQ